MQPPISPGTTLQNRYRVLEPLGKGGFGRTYLCEDQTRFNELCVLKEFIPAANTPTESLGKARELFQREAQVLYQIHHPQVPRFRASFGEGQQWFLAQDFVAGKTYKTLLEERLSGSQTFSEAEVLHLMLQLLPVLTYLHGQNIIHRDISPDNIILREKDLLPVLIDFGVVKELAQRVEGGEEATPKGTTIGKLGYAPTEQLRTGQAYPNSDLYALAVTAVVLMTGRKPHELLDQATLTWRWIPWLPAVTPQVIQLLQRMLSPAPKNRPQSAQEVLLALNSLQGLAPPPAPPQLKLTPKMASAPATGAPPVFQPAPANSPAPPQSGISWAIGAVTLLVLAGIAWSLVRALGDTPRGTSSPPPPASTLGVASLPPLPVPTSTPGVAPLPSPVVSTPAPTPSAPVFNSQPLTFSGGVNRVQVSGHSSSDQLSGYQITIPPDQGLSVRVLSGPVTLEIKDDQGQVLQMGVTSWQATASDSEQQVQVYLVPNQTPEADFILEADLQASGALSGSP